jgi:bis(5'-nucleosidyl)-tetraphosphatase
VIYVLHEKSCGAVVFFKTQEETKYLLLHYKAGHWDFVKGNVEIDESEKETVLRELREETGIVDAHFVEGFKEKIQYFYRRQGDTVQKEVIFFVIQSETEAVKLSFEHIGFIWLDYKTAMEKLTFKNARDILQKAHEFLKNKEVIKS